MADPILSPAAAFSNSIDDFLYTQQKRKHEELMDSIARDREQRLGQSEQLDLELRREELKQRREVSQEKVKDTRTKAFYTKLHELAPGDVPSAEFQKEAAELGVPLRLGAAPTPPFDPAAVGPMAGGEDPLGTPPTPDQTARPYLGNRSDVARNKLADTIESGADRPGVVASALRLGIDPREIGATLNAENGPAVHYSDKENLRIRGTGKIPIFDPVRGAYLDPDTRAVVPGTQIERVPAPRDPVVEALARATLADKQRQNTEAASAIKPGTPEYTMAQDLAAGKLTYQDVLRSYAFQRTGREQARKIYQMARELNPKLNPVSIQAELHAYTGELTKLQGQVGAVESYASAANKNAQLLDKVLDKIPDTGFSGKPNEWVRHASKFMGSEDVAAFNGLMTSLQSEYSRLISNPNLTGVVTDSTRQEFRDILDKGGTKAQIRRLLSTLKQESENRHRGLKETIAGVKGEIGDVAGGGAAPTPTSKYKVTIKD